MRLWLRAKMPHEPCNTLVREGKAKEILGRILEETKPEAVYFVEDEGQRCAVLFVNVEKTSEIPSISEPWFLNFNADCRMRVALSPEDLENAGLDRLGEKWR